MHVEPIVLDFLKAYPDINARLVLADHVVNLVDDQVDVAIRIGRLPDSSMIATRIGQIGWVTCASPQYLWRRGARQKRLQSWSSTTASCLRASIQTISGVSDAG
ncbi:LysR substrate-binding domain-containing protein [Bradyrhizobium sp. A5]|uniref:LysR substrate-binding domain-containing protein n=1 Tax=Bradyrhizobium sp. A5 TaxID=3133696 RepID=UPI0035C82C50